MAKTLEMVFRDTMGKEVIISLPDPQDSITLAQVQAVMQDIVTRNIFVTKNGDFDQYGDARIVSRDTTVLM